MGKHNYKTEKCIKYILPRTANSSRVTTSRQTQQNSTDQKTGSTATTAHGIIKRGHRRGTGTTANVPTNQPTKIRHSCPSKRREPQLSTKHLILRPRATHCARILTPTLPTHSCPVCCKQSCQWRLLVALALTSLITHVRHFRVPC